MDVRKVLNFSSDEKTSTSALSVEGKGKLQRTISESGLRPVSRPFGDPVHAASPTGLKDSSESFSTLSTHPAGILLGKDLIFRNTASMWNKMEVMPTEDFGKKQGQSPYEIDCLQYFKAKASTDPAVDGGERTKSSKNSSQSSEKEPGEPVAEAKDKYAFIQLSSQEDYDYDDEDDEDDDIEEEDDEEGDDESDDDIEAKLLANRILRNERPKPEEYKLTKAAYEELSRRGAPLSPPAGLKTAKGEGETGKQMDVSAMLEDVVDREVAAYESGGKKVEAELSAV